MGELGARLREAREELGLTLDDVEDRTRIRRAFIEALEEERFNDLPGDVYARGFIRNYASLLGLNAEELLQAYRRAAHITEKRIPQVLDEPLMRRSTARTWRYVLLGIVGVAIVAAAAWSAYSYFYTPSDANLSAAAKTATAEVQSVMPLESGTSSLRRTVTPAEQSTAPATPERRLSPTESIPSPTRPLPSPTPSPTDTPQPTPTAMPQPTPTPTRAESIRVEARLLAKTYVEVRIDGELVFVDILEAGQHQTWTAREAIKLRIGNAGGIRLIVNGVDLGIMGEPQQVIDVEYTLDNLPKG